MSIYDFMTQRGYALTEPEIKHIYRHICIALHRLHKTAGLAHLDIKEENILIDPKTLHPILIDFATTRLVKPRDSKNPTPMIGSPIFPATEVNGEKCKWKVKDFS